MKDASSPAEAQSLASSQAGDAGAAAFSDAVYNYTAVRMCLGGRAMQAENAAAGKLLNPQPPPPPPLSGVSPAQKCSVHDSSLEVHCFLSEHPAPLSV